MTRTGRVVVKIGAGVLLVGVLLIAFVAYQLWGTGLYEEHAQAHLKSELSQQLHRQLPTSAAQLTGAQRLHLPPLQHETALTLPEPQVNQPIGLLSIPKIGLLDAIVEGVVKRSSSKGPGTIRARPSPEKRATSPLPATARRTPIPSTTSTSSGPATRSTS